MLFRSDVEHWLLCQRLALLKQGIGSCEDGSKDRSSEDGGGEAHHGTRLGVKERKAAENSTPACELDTSDEIAEEPHRNRGRLAPSLRSSVIDPTLTDVPERSEAALQGLESSCSRLS